MCNTYYSPSLRLMLLLLLVVLIRVQSRQRCLQALLGSALGIFCVKEIGPLTPPSPFTSLSLSLLISLMNVRMSCREGREREREGEKEKSRLCLKRLMDIATLFTPFPVPSPSRTSSHTHARAHTHALTYVRPTNWFLHLQQDNFGAIFFIPSLFLFSSLISLYLFVHLFPQSDRILA